MPISTQTKETFRLEILAVRDPVLLNEILKILTQERKFWDLFDPRSREFRPEQILLLRKAHALCQADPVLAKELAKALRKISLDSPKSTKHTRDKSPEESYAGNPYDLCQYLSLFWLKSHIRTLNPYKRNKSLKSEFYEATQRRFMPRVPAAEFTVEYKSEQQKALIQRLEEKNLGGIDPNRFVHDCDSVLQMAPVGIFHTISFIFANMINNIISQMLLQAIQEVGIFIASFDLQHAMAMMIKVHKNYINVVFYDPNAEFGDEKMSLSRGDLYSWNPRINQLISKLSYLRNFTRNCDFTLACFYTNPLLHIPFNKSNIRFSPKQFSSILRSKFLLNVITMGDAHVYCQAIQDLFNSGELNVNIRWVDGATPLYIAAQNGHTESVRLLLSRTEILVNQAQDDGATPLYIAAQNGHTEVVRLLLSRTEILVNQAVYGATPLYIAAQNGHTEVVRLLLARPEILVNQALNDGATPLLIAVSNGHDAIVDLLANHTKINLNVPFSGKTALQFAQLLNLANMIKILEAAHQKRRY